MLLAEAKALLERKTSSAAAHFEPSAPAADLAALRKLARWCRRFSPSVGLEEGPEPASLLLDITGCAHLFGGEPAQARHVLRDFQRRGLTVRVAIADTLGAAWAVAHYGFPPAASGARIVPPGQQAERLQALPVAALRLPEHLVHTLHELDLRQISQLQAVPRASLAARFGPLIRQRLDQALGRAAELLTAERPAEPLQCGWSGDDPLTNRWAIGLVLEQLLQQLLEQVSAQRRGVQQLLCRLSGPQQEAAQFSVGLVRPSASPRHVLELLQLQWERLALPAEITAITLDAAVTAALACRQTEIFADAAARDNRPELETLIERLSSRLGREAVLAPRLAADAQPEYAVRYEAWVGRPRASGTDRSPITERRRTVRHAPLVARLSFPEWELPLFRPPRLRSEPIPIEVTPLSPEGPPGRVCWQNRTHTITRSWGPERIETGWWRHQFLRRDYYRVELHTGQHFWLFRRVGQGDWFLQGEFS
jgi:protein ImuB